MNIVIDNRIRFPEMEEELEREFRELFEYKNPDYYKALGLGFSTRGIPLVVKTWKKERDGTFSLPRGGMQRVRSVLGKFDLQHRWIDKRVRGEPLFETFTSKVTLWDFQEDLLKTAFEKEQALIRSPTGSGKTEVGVSFAAIVKVPTLVVVHNSGLRDQWFKRAMKSLDIRESEIGMLGGGKNKIAPFTIAMHQTLARGKADSEEVKNYFGAVIMDEVQRAPATTAFNAIDPLPARYRLGVSASEKRKDKKEFLVYDLFGEPVAEIDREELVAKGKIVDVEIRIVPTEFVTQIPSDELMMRTNDLYDEMVNDRARNSLVIDCAMHEVQRGDQVFVLSRRRAHCFTFDQEFVRRKVASGLLIGGGQDAAAFAESIIGIEQKKIAVGIGTFEALGTGIDLPSVSVAIVALPIGTNEQFFNQVRGRVCRSAEGKSGARCYYLWDRNVFGWKHIKNICSWNPTVTILQNGEWKDAREVLHNR